MIYQGIWILAMVLKIGAHEIVVLPYEYYPSFQLCNAWKSDAERKLGVTMTCTRERDI